MTAVYKFWTNTSGIFRGQIEMLKSNFDDQDKISAEISYADNGNMVRVENMSKEDARALVTFVKDTWNSVGTSVNTKNRSVKVDIFDMESVKDPTRIDGVIKAELKDKKATMVSILFKTNCRVCSQRECTECPFYMAHTGCGGGCAAEKYRAINNMIAH